MVFAYSPLSGQKASSSPDSPPNTITPSPAPIWTKAAQPSPTITPQQGAGKLARRRSLALPPLQGRVHAGGVHPGFDRLPTRGGFERGSRRYFHEAFDRRL